MNWQTASKTHNKWLAPPRPAVAPEKPAANVSHLLEGCVVSKVEGLGKLQWAGFASLETLYAMHNTAELMTEVTRGAMRSLCVVAVLLVSSGALAAQRGAVWIGAGAAVPTGGTGDRYTVGPAAVFSLETELNPRVAVRLDAEWSRVAGGKLSSYPADLRRYGASLNALLRLSEGRIVLYAPAGLGGYRLQRIGDDPSVYGTTAAVQAGSGIEVRVWHALEPFIEARGVMHVTDYTSDEFTASVLWPLMAGLGVPLRR